MRRLGVAVASVIALGSTACGAGPASQTAEEPETVRLPLPTSTAAPSTEAVSPVKTVADEFGNDDWFTSASPILTFLGISDDQEGFERLEVVHHDIIVDCMSAAGYEYIPPLLIEAQDRAFELNESRTLDERIAFDEALNGFNTENPDDGCFNTSQVNVFPGKALRDELLSAGDLLAKCIEARFEMPECERFSNFSSPELKTGTDDFIRVSEIIVLDQDRDAVQEFANFIARSES